jgi:hypothetical protein
VSSGCTTRAYGTRIHLRFAAQLRKDFVTERRSRRRVYVEDVP